MSIPVYIPKSGRDPHPPPLLVHIRERDIAIWRTIAEALGVVCIGLLAWAIWLQVTS
jgi:hypothetical protein